MKYILLIILIIFSFTIVNAEEVTIENAKGTAKVVDGDTKKARDDARTEALIDAIRQATGITISVETTAKNFTEVEEIMQSKTKGKVISFNPIMDENVEGVYIFVAKVVIDVPEKDSEVKDTTATEGLIIKNNILLGYNGNEKIIVIPEGIKSIDKSAFRDNKSIKKVILPKSLEKIGDSAFENCEKLIEINLNDNITYIGKSCFENCISLNEITIPKGVTIIEEDCFLYCYNLEKINLHNQIKEIKKRAFAPKSKDGGKENKSLRKLVIPGSVEVIGIGAFQCYSNIEELIIEDGVKRIEDKAFMNVDTIPNKSLRKLVIPGSVEVIGVSAFQDYSNIEELIIEDGVKKIEEGAFACCKETPNKSLKKLVIPGSVEVIGIAGFYCYSNIEELIIEDGVKKIDEFAFANKEATVNKTLKKLVIPGSVEVIGKYAFQCYSNIEELIIENGVKRIEYGAFMLPNNSPNKSLKKLVIPGSVEVIGQYAFQFWEGLREVSISRRTKIQDNTFVACPNVKLEYRD